MRTQKPDKLISLDNKPIITETSYPYYSMDHRSFELLLYALYEQEIRHGELAGMYNDIWLMEGVREKGKDCALYKQGELAAVIQCKHRSKLTSIGKVDVAKEIIKFVLHIINNRQEVVQPFNYYFVVSSDFDSKSRELLEDFNNRIILEKDIEKWTASVINETKTLSQLELADIRQPLHHFLTSMVVHHKASTDITLLLNKPYNTHIIEMFFSIKKVIDVSTVLSETEKIQTKLANIQNSLKTPPSEEEVMEQFSRSSALLSTYNNYFFNLPQSHITRKETTELFNWIKTPLPSAKDEDKILLLTGNAGYGKSVILRDLFEALRGENIPVLGIKADRYPVSSVKELEEKLYLKNNIYGQLQSLSSQFEKVVVLIDQIDALSQTLSSQREALSAYRLFINAIKEIDNVRIIISVRTFDLNYDPDLQFYKSQKIVPVALLNEEEVNGVLSNLNLDPSTVSSSLKVLLKTPNHLNVFCKIFKPGYAIESIKTVQDLYQQLWKQTVVEIPTGSALNSLSVKQCLQTLARYINEKQQ
ncbi:MAG: AAA family ATPase, partial [Flavisolibacter sp.]